MRSSARRRLRGDQMGAIARRRQSRQIGEGRTASLAGSAANVSTRTACAWPALAAPDL